MMRYMAKATKVKPVSTTFKKRYDEARNFRVKQEAGWMEIDYMLDGNHFVYYDAIAKEIKTLPTAKKGTVRRTVNIMRSKVRSLSNMITKNEPAFNVRPTYNPQMRGEDAQAAKHKAEVLQHHMLHVYRKNDMRQKFKQAVRIAVKRGLAIGHVYWGDDKDDIEFCVEDPFNILLDPISEGDIQRSRWLIRSMVCDLEALKESGKYKNLERVDPTTQLSPSTYRDSYLQSKYSTENREGKVILHQMWEKVETSEPEVEPMEPGEAPEKKKKIKVTYFVGDGSNGPVREDEYDYEHYPFMVYYPEMVDGEVYPRPFFADIVQLNKSLDAMYSFVEEYIGVLGQGRFLMHEKTKLTSPITGRHGQFLKYSGSTPPTPMDTPRIPMDVIQGHMSNTERYMSEIGGIQFIDANAVTGSNTSGRAIAQLQAQQAESVGEPTDNLASFAKQVFDCILELQMNMLTEPVSVPNSNDDSTETYQLRGKAGIIPGIATPEGETVLDEVPQYRIEIIPGSAFSELQKKADIIELFDKQLVDKETVLDAYKIGSVREIIEKMEREQAEAAEAQANMQERQGNVQNLLEREKQMGIANDQADVALAGHIGDRRAGDPNLDAMMQAMDQQSQQPQPQGV